MTDTSTIIAGFDVSKDRLDIAIDGRRQRWQVANTPDGWAELVRLLRRHGVVRVGCEASGGYERGAVEHLRAEGFAVVVLQPLQVRAFAQLTLCRAKSDAIDAGLIAACTADDHRRHNGGEDGKRGDREPPDPRLVPLADRLTFIEQTEEDIARLKVRLEHVRDAGLRRTVLADIARLQQRRATMIAKLATLLRGHEDLARRLDLVVSIEGIGPRTALALVVRMPELGRLSRGEAAALAGLAPFVQDSGTHKGQRHITGGRGRLRKSLYAAALPAAFRWNHALVALYRRLVAAGKPHKLALVACARKLLVFANTVLARQTPWLKAAQPV